MKYQKPIDDTAKQNIDIESQTETASTSSKSKPDVAEDEDKTSCTIEEADANGDERDCEDENTDGTCPICLNEFGKLLILKRFGK